MDLLLLPRSEMCPFLPVPGGILSDCHFVEYSELQLSPRMIWPPVLALLQLTGIFVINF